MQRLPTYSTLFYYKTGDEKELWGGKDMSLSLLGKYFLLKNVIYGLYSSFCHAAIRKLT